MNPFYLRGPEFLFFYFCLSLAVILAIYFLRRRAESGPAPKIDLADPYLIAYLRGGDNEALRVAVISLVDRGLLVMEGPLLYRADHGAGNMVNNPVEREALKRFGNADKAASVFKDDNLKSALKPYRQKLKDAGLLPDLATHIARLTRFLIAALALVATGVIKIQIGLSLNKPVQFLLLAMIAAVGITAACSFSRLTVRGEAMLVDIANLYSGLRTRVNSFSPGGASTELALLVAVFGVGALAATPYGYAQTLFPQTSSGSSCGSSCGSSGESSCSSSDSGGGGDGGGCGGCGGE